MLSLRAGGGNVGFSPLLVGWTEVVMVASQTQKRNTSEQIVPINPDNNTQGKQRNVGLVHYGDRTGQLWKGRMLAFSSVPTEIISNLLR